MNMKFISWLGTIFLFVVMFLFAVIFNASYINGVYVLGIIPVLGMFNITAPVITYKMFICIVITIMSVKEYFKDYTKKSGVEIDVKDAKSVTDGLGKLLTAVVSSIFTKVLVLIILGIANIILF